MRKLGFELTVALAALTFEFVAAAGPAAAGPPTVQPLEAVCTAAGGLFFGEFFFQNRAACDSNINAGIALSEPYISAARNLCLHGYKADFFVISGTPQWPTWNCGFLH